MTQLNDADDKIGLYSFGLFHVILRLYFIKTITIIWTHVNSILIAGVTL